MSFIETVELIKSKEKREKLIEQGEETARKYLDSSMNEVF